MGRLLRDGAGRHGADVPRERALNPGDTLTLASTVFYAVHPGAEECARRTAASPSATAWPPAQATVMVASTALMLGKAATWTGDARRPLAGGCLGGPC